MKKQIQEVKILVFGFRFGWTTSGNYPVCPEMRELNHSLPGNSCLYMSWQKAEQFSLKTDKQREQKEIREQSDNY